MKAAAISTLLGPVDPEPVEVINPDSTSPVLLLCEHAGTAVPTVLEGLGVTNDILRSHRGWDIGAEAVARRLAAHLHAPLILQRYSRLVVDANRPPESAGSVPEVSDGTPIPGNRAIPDWQRRARVAEIFMPMDQEIVRQFAKHDRQCAFSVHSFTPRLGGQVRPWHAGFLNRSGTQVAAHLMASVQARGPAFTLALNAPYTVSDDTDWFIPAHVEPRGIPHCLFEIRNDQIDADAGAAHWAQLLADAIWDLLGDLT